MFVEMILSNVVFEAEVPVVLLSLLRFVVHNYT